MAAAATSARRIPLSRRTDGGWALAIGACVLVAALSLLISRQATYDPTAWLIWGREIVHGDLSTTAGPSWKPLPVLVTVPGALLGDGAQQDLLLIAARAGMLAGAVLAYRLAWRLEGPVAGVIAAAALLVSSGYLSRVFRGDSEGALVALALGAVEAHLLGRRRLAFGLLVATALLRPEMWLFAGLYALWLMVAAGSRERRLRAAAIVAGAGVLVVVAWLIPEEIGSGRLLRAASRALDPVAGSPATAAFPFGATFTNAAPVLPWPLYAAGVVYVATALRDPRRPDRRLTIALAGAATALMVIVALMAEMGFTGNSRYLTIPIGLTGILGAAGLVRITRVVRERLAPRPAAIAVALLVVVSVVFGAYAVARTRDQMDGGLAESARYAVLDAAIARAGGPRAVQACGQVYTEWFDVQVIARALGVHMSSVSIHPDVPGTVVAHRGAPIADPRAYPRPLATTGQWEIATSCRR